MVIKFFLWFVRLNFVFALFLSFSAHFSGYSIVFLLSIAQK